MKINLQAVWEGIISLLTGGVLAGLVVTGRYLSLVVPRMKLFICLAASQTACISTCIRSLSGTAYTGAAAFQPVTVGRCVFSGQPDSVSNDRAAE